MTTLQVFIWSLWKLEVMFQVELKMDRGVLVSFN